MKKRLCHFALSLLIVLPLSAQAQVRRQRRTNNSPIIYALRLAKAGRYAEASKRFFILSIDPRYSTHQAQIKYLLGLTLYQLHLYQTAAFQFVDVIRSGQNRYLRKSLEKLSLAADRLGNEVLLNYAIARIKIEDFPPAHQDMLYYRIGEFKLRNQLYDDAARSFGNVRPASNLFFKARYMQALAYADNKQPAKAVAILDQLLQSYSNLPETDTNRVAALMGKARALYQNHQWDEAIEAYREVPRDTSFWHDALFESSWAMLRAARFRSALGNFESLHSSYYDDYYMPESLLLRAIVYLYICKYDEMQKTLDVFSRTYGPIHHNLIAFLNANSDPLAYYNEVAKVADNFERYKSNLDKRKDLYLPFLVSRKVISEGDFQSGYAYIKKLRAERARIDSLGPSWKNSGMGRYAIKLISVRTLNAKKALGFVVRTHLIAMQSELRDFFEQSEFLKYEQLNGLKNALKKKIAGETVPDKHVDDAENRSYYIKNGYEYWPFRGEYWLDEIGNYHYVGVQSCE